MSTSYHILNVFFCQRTRLSNNAAIFNHVVEKKKNIVD